MKLKAKIDLELGKGEAKQKIKAGDQFEIPDNQANGMIAGGYAESLKNEPKPEASGDESEGDDAPKKSKKKGK